MSRSLARVGVVVWLACLLASPRVAAEPARQESLRGHDSASPRTASPEIAQYCRSLENNVANFESQAGGTSQQRSAMRAEVASCWAQYRKRRAEEAAASLKATQRQSTATTDSLQRAADQFQSQMQDFQRAQAARAERERAEREAERAREEAKEDARLAAQELARSRFEATIRTSFAEALFREQPGDGMPPEKLCRDEYESELLRLVSPISFEKQCGAIRKADAQNEACRRAIALGTPVGNECEDACRASTVATRRFPAACKGAGTLGLAWSGIERELGATPDSWVSESAALSASYSVVYEAAVLSDGSPGFRPTKGRITFCPKRRASPAFPGFTGGVVIRFHWAAENCSALDAFEDQRGSCKSLQPPAAKLSLRTVADRCVSTSVDVAGPPQRFKGILLRPMNVEARDGTGQRYDF